jgi:hypothetical protein
VTFDEDRVAPAKLAEVMGDGTANHATADDDNARYRELELLARVLPMIEIDSSKRDRFALFDGLCFPFAPTETSVDS